MNLYSKYINATIVHGMQGRFPSPAALRTRGPLSRSNCSSASGTQSSLAGSHLKPKVVVIGAGWAGYRVALDLDKSKYLVELVSPRNHFLFTPLLPSTAVGTLEFRAIQEPVRTIPGVQYYQAEVDAIDFDGAKVHCNDSFNSAHDFRLSYDALVVATGCETNTFGVQGVYNNPHVFFLKQLHHARAIRDRLIECFERASSPGVEAAEMKRLLTFVIVGGGPTNVEFAAELYDFLKTDVSRWYPDLHQHARVMIVERGDNLLGTFHMSLVSYVERLYKTRNIEIIVGTAVNQIKEDIAVLSSGVQVPFGLLVWSTGLKQVSVVDQLSADNVAKFPNGRLKTDAFLRVLASTSSKNVGGSTRSSTDSNKPVGNGRVFALGDCAAEVCKPLPPLAQVAGQQGTYLAQQMNKHGIDFNSDPDSRTFNYQHLGSMAQVGEWRGVVDSSGSGFASNAPPVKGFVAFLLWRAAYWTKQVSIQNKMLIPMYWFKSMIFGRDISRF